MSQRVASDDSEERSGVNQREPFFFQSNAAIMTPHWRVAFNLAHFESGREQHSAGGGCSDTHTTRVHAKDPEERRTETDRTTTVRDLSVCLLVCGFNVKYEVDVEGQGVVVERKMKLLYNYILILCCRSQTTTGAHGCRSRAPLCQINIRLRKNKYSLGKETKEIII